MKNKRLLPIAFLSTLFLVGGVVACNNGGTSKPATDTSEKSQFAVAISNKDALKAKWYVGDVQRSVTAALTPEGNALEELAAGNLTVTSSAPTIVAASGLGLTPVAAGKATITVTYHDASDSVELTVLENSAQARYGTAHAGTAEDPFSNEDALIVAKHPDYKEAQTDFYVRGEVASFYNCPGERTDGKIAYFLKPAQAGGEQFEVYSCLKDGETAAAKKPTDDDIWVGGIATAHGKFVLYNGQYETSSAVLVSCTGTKPAARQTIKNKTVAEIIAMAAAYPDGANSWDYYEFEAYVTTKAGNNFFLTATKGEELVTAKSDDAHGKVDYYTNAIELYFYAAPSEALQGKLLQDAKVKVKMVVKNYHGTIQNCFNPLADDDVTVLEEGTKWNVPEPTVATKTVKEFKELQDDGKKALAYNVTGTIKSFKNASTKDDFGNMVLTDASDSEGVIIYGATVTESALAWDKASAYAWKNPNDFQKKDATQALAVGNTITMKLVRNDYTDKNTGKVTIEGVGIITNIVPVATTAVQISKTTETVQAGKTVALTLTRTPENSNTPAVWTSSDDSIATVEAGVVTGVAAGEATITATLSETVTAQCVVTVTQSEQADVKWTSAELFGYDGSADIGYNTVTEKTLNGITLTLTDMAAFKNQGGDIQFKKTTGFITFKTATQKRIAKLELELSGSKNCTVKVYGASDVAGLASASAVTGANQVYTFDATANCHALKIGGGTGASYLKSISIFYAN